MAETAMQKIDPKTLTGDARKFYNVKQLLNANMKAIASVLPQHIKPERLLRIVTTTVQKNPKLMDCSPESFIGCVLSTAALGLETDPLLGQAYLVPYWDNKTRKSVCTLIPGYKGLMKLARQSGEVATIDAHEVRIGDEFDFGYGSNPFLVHKPARCPRINGEDGRDRPDPSWKPGEIEYYYAIAKMKDGTCQFRVMPLWEVYEHRDCSEGYKFAVDKGFTNNPWMTDEVEMGKKTAIRALSKMIPASVEKDNKLQQAISADERGDRGVDQNLENIHGVDAEMIVIPAEVAEQPPTPGPEEEGRKMKLGGKAEPADK